MGISPAELQKVFADLASATANTPVQVQNAASAETQAQNDLNVEYQNRLKKQQEKAKQGAFASTVLGTRSESTRLNSSHSQQSRMPSSA